LSFILKNLEDAPHIRRVRFHTRVLTTLPTRLDSELVSILARTRLSLWIAAHVNSHLEITPDCISTVKRLQTSGIGLVSQSVLLKGVNDSEESLSLLFESLLDLGIKPYYLHYPDLARGTSHFRIPLERALEIYSNLRGKLSGLAIPQFMIDIPGGYGKIEANSRNLQPTDSPYIWRMRSPQTGNWIQVQYPEFTRAS
jgi:lysine 2,3-aminomutase